MCEQCHERPATCDGKCDLSGRLCDQCNRRVAQRGGKCYSCLTEDNGGVSVRKQCDKCHKRDAKSGGWCDSCYGAYKRAEDDRWEALVAKADKALGFGQ